MIGRVERRGMELHGAWPGVGTEQREEPGLVQAGGAGPNYCDNGTKENGHATVLTWHRPTWPGDGHGKKDNYKMVQTQNYKPQIQTEGQMSYKTYLRFQTTHSFSRFRKLFSHFSRLDGTFVSDFWQAREDVILLPSKTPKTSNFLFKHHFTWWRSLQGKVLNWPLTWYFRTWEVFTINWTELKRLNLKINGPWLTGDF